jgi:hypothetical protein
MNAAGIKAIEDALGIARDQLRRAEHQKKKMPEWTSGSGVNIDAVIKQFKKQEQELLEALAEARLRDHVGA